MYLNKILWSGNELIMSAGTSYSVNRLEIPYNNKYKLRQPEILYFLYARVFYLNFFLLKQYSCTNARNMKYCIFCDHTYIYARET